MGEGKHYSLQGTPLPRKTTRDTTTPAGKHLPGSPLAAVSTRQLPSRCSQHHTAGLRTVCISDTCVCGPRPCQAVPPQPNHGSAFCSSWMSLARTRLTRAFGDMAYWVLLPSVLLSFRAKRQKRLRRAVYLLPTLSTAKRNQADENL